MLELPAGKLDVAGEEEERDMTVERLTLDEATRAVAGGAITGAKTIVGLLLAQRWLESTE